MPKPAAQQFPSIAELRYLQTLNLNKSQDFARDMFLFSLYARGMNYVDMAYLKKSNLKDGMLTYISHTSDNSPAVTIKWDKAMQQIADKYTSDTEYIFPIITKEGNADETEQIKRSHYKKCYIWVLVNKAERVVIFFYDNGSRGRDVLTDFIGDAELKSIMSDGYNAYTFIGNELKAAETPNLSKTDHQVCLAHARAKFVKASEQAGDKNADIFIKYIDDLYNLERQYTKDNLTDEERGKQRQSLETKGILINLRTHLGIEKAKDPATVTPYLQKALNYLDTFWTNLFTYIKDGSYPIDNNAAERAVRPLTTQRNSMLHFGSDDGAKMAATYHSIISTVKLQRRSSWDYLGKFFVKSLIKRIESSLLEFLSVKTLSNIFNGCRDFFSLRPDKFSCQRVQSQTCLNYAERSRKS